MNDKYEPSRPIWSSYVWHKEKCYSVSTIERTYDCYSGSFRGQETIVWEYDWKKRERGEMLSQSGGIVDHQRICRCIIALGEILDEYNPRHERFLK